MSQKKFGHLDVGTEIPQKIVGSMNCNSINRMFTKNKSQLSEFDVEFVLCVCMCVIPYHKLS